MGQHTRENRIMVSENNYPISGDLHEPRRTFRVRVEVCEDGRPVSCGEAMGEARDAFDIGEVLQRAVYANACMEEDTETTRMLVFSALFAVGREFESRNKIPIGHVERHELESLEYFKGVCSRMASILMGKGMSVEEYRDLAANLRGWASKTDELVRP
jgi:hypothetical protein